MASRTRPLAFGAFLLAFGLCRAAQAPQTADAAWQTLEAQIKPATSVASLLETADQAKTYYTQNPQSSHAEEAREQEIVLLIRAAELGDKTQTARLASLAQSFQADATVPSHLRFVTASQMKALAIWQTPHLDQAGLLAAYEASARAMIAAYPQEPLPYWALYALARDAVDESHGAALANELLAMAGAPPAVKTAAQALLARQALVGQPLDFAFTTADAQTHHLSDYKGAPVLLYTWSASDPGSIALAQTLAKRAPAPTVLLGIDLDADAAASALAQQDHLGALQVIAPSAAGLIARLHFTAPGQVFLIDASGVLQDDRGQMGLNGKLAALQKKGGA